MDELKSIREYAIFCKHRPPDCGMEPTYSRSVLEFEGIREDSQKIRDWTGTRTTVEGCYTNLLSAMKAKLSSLLPDTSTCDTIAHYKDFLQKLSLWPLTLDVLVKPEKYFIQGDPTDFDPVNIKLCMCECVLQII